MSLVDAGNTVVFIKAESLGMTGTETPDEIEGNKELVEKIEALRSKAAVCFGLTEKEEDAYEKSPYNPFFAIVSSPACYRCFTGKSVDEKDVDIVSRLWFMHRMHKAYPITGTVCTGAAMRISGSIPWEVMHKSTENLEVMRIGHPAGVLEVQAEAEGDGAQTRMKKIKVYRTARMIMDGTVYVKKE